MNYYTKNKKNNQHLNTSKNKKRANDLEPTNSKKEQRLQAFEKDIKAQILQEFKTFEKDIKAQSLQEFKKSILAGGYKNFITSNKLQILLDLTDEEAASLLKDEAATWLDGVPILEKIKRILKNNQRWMKGDTSKKALRLQLFAEGIVSVIWQNILNSKELQILLDLTDEEAESLRKEEAATFLDGVPILEKIKRILKNNQRWMRAAASALIASALIASAPIAEASALIASAQEERKATTAKHSIKFEPKEKYDLSSNREGKAGLPKKFDREPKPITVGAYAKYLEMLDNFERDDAGASVKECQNVRAKRSDVENNCYIILMEEREFLHEKTKPRIYRKKEKYILYKNYSSGTQAYYFKYIGRKIAIIQYVKEKYLHIEFDENGNIKSNGVHGTIVLSYDTLNKYYEECERNLRTPEQVKQFALNPVSAVAAYIFKTYILKNGNTLMGKVIRNFKKEFEGIDFYVKTMDSKRTGLLHLHFYLTTKKLFDVQEKKDDKNKSYYVSPQLKDLEEKINDKNEIGEIKFFPSVNKEHIDYVLKKVMTSEEISIKRLNEMHLQDIKQKHFSINPTEELHIKNVYTNRTCRLWRINRMSTSQNIADMLEHDIIEEIDEQHTADPSLRKKIDPNLIKSANAHFEINPESIIYYIPYEELPSD